MQTRKTLNTDTFHAVPESPIENTNNVVLETISDISITDTIDRSHRLAKQSTNQKKSRPKIVTLAKYNI